MNNSDLTSTSVQMMITKHFSVPVDMLGKPDTGESPSHYLGMPVRENSDYTNAFIDFLLTGNSVRKLNIQAKPIVTRPTK